MDTSTLHATTEAFASYLSEVTPGDLAFATPCEGWDVSDLYRHMLVENVHFGLAVTGDHDAPDELIHTMTAPASESRAHSDGALEARYRRSASFMEEAFASATDPHQMREVAGASGYRTIHDLYEMQLCDTVIHTWDLTRAIGFTYEADSEVADTVLRLLEALPDAARGGGEAFGPVRSSVNQDHSVLERIILLSGRTI
ncbi:MAG: TIGR03086 family metal-binding protein [Pseudonocardia sp.]